MLAIFASVLALSAVDGHAEKKIPTADEVLDMMDANGDGTVTLEEYKAHKGDEADVEHFADVAGEDGVANRDDIEAAIKKYHSEKAESATE